MQLSMPMTDVSTYCYARRAAGGAGGGTNGGHTSGDETASGSSSSSEDDGEERPDRVPLHMFNMTFWPHTQPLKVGSSDHSFTHGADV